MSSTIGRPQVRQGRREQKVTMKLREELARRSVLGMAEHFGMALVAGQNTSASAHAGSGRSNDRSPAAPFARALDAFS